MTPEELESVADAERIANAAVDAYLSICGREDVQSLYAAGRAFHETPFTISMNGRIVRGTIDCLVETAPGRLAILEFKTGLERDQDRQQVDLYLRAVRQLFPDAAIDVHIIYAGSNRALPV
jgi:hypothetical protein